MQKVTVGYDLYLIIRQWYFGLLTFAEKRVYTKQTPNLDKQFKYEIFLLPKMSCTVDNPVSFVCIVFHKHMIKLFIINQKKKNWSSLSHMKIRFSYIQIDTTTKTHTLFGVTVQTKKLEKIYIENFVSFKMQSHGPSKC